MSVSSTSIGTLFQSGREALVRCALPVLGTAVMTCLLWIVPSMAVYPLIQYSLSVVASAWLGGFWSGVAASILGALAADYFFIAPLDSIDGRHGLPIVSFLAMGLLVSLMAQALHAQRRIITETEELRESRERAEAALRTSEVDLREAQKMQAVGRLAGGVAHDFNNVLTIILSHAHLMLRDPLVKTSTHLGDDLIEVKTAAERAAQLTHQLLAYSRRQVLQPRPFDLNATLVEMRQMVQRTVGDDIELVLRLAPDLGHVLCDPVQIQQVIMNLVVNARDAMPGGGRLTVSTGRSPLASERALLTVADNGQGMDEVTRSHIFEPFFTTKPTGKSNGLGLSTVHGIVEQSGGTISVRSAPGQGSTFEVELPVAHPPAPAVEARPATAELRGSETVLVVEDEPQLREIVRSVLSEQGYKVILASNGADALRHAAGANGSIDLVLTDVVMPVMSGPTLVERLAAIRPHARVLFVSGYSDEILASDFPEVAFLQKPLTPDGILAKVRQVLDAPDGRFAAGRFARHNGS